MGNTVFANCRGIVHETSNGQSIAFPDVCNTPSAPAPIPIPYPNIGMSSDTSNGSKTVKTDGSSAMVEGAEYRRTSGDEAGVVGGIMSGVNMGKAEFITNSFDVKFEGKGVCRMGDMVTQNSKNAFGVQIGEPIKVPIP